MITYVNSSNANDYSVLFESANQALLDAQVEGFLPLTDESGVPIKDDAGLVIPAEPITTIEQYFFWLNELANIDKAKIENNYDLIHSEGRRYTMLPLDEEVFMVDANTREIAVPESFKKNGIAVQGDKYAEIVYFVVDRFYDITDLDACDCYIQWTNAAGDKGVSVPWVIDIVSEPNKMIIGWAVSEKISLKAGSVKFALRFFQWDKKEDDTIRFSWSTQTQTAQVKTALDFTLLGAPGENDPYYAEIEGSENSGIIDRIANSNSHIAGVEPAERPEILKNLEGVYIDPEADVAYVDLIDNVAYPELEGFENIYPLEVQARSTDGGAISYTWKYRDYFTDEEQGSDLGTPTSNVPALVRVDFREVTITRENFEEVRNSKKIFYVKDDKGDTPVYKQVTLPDDVETVIKNVYFEKVALCVVTQVGKYFCIVTNRKAAKNIATRNSRICIIPMPSYPVIVTDIPVLGHIGVNVADEENGQVASTVSLTIEVTNEETNGTGVGELKYFWYKRRIKDGVPQKDEIFTKDDTFDFKLDEDGNEITVDSATADWNYIADAPSQKTLVLTNSEEAMDKPKTIEGHYMVLVYNCKNNKYLFVGSRACRISYEAEAPLIAYPDPGEAGGDQTKVGWDTIQNGTYKDKCRVELDKTWAGQWNISDEYEYQWFSTIDEIADNPGDTPVDCETAKSAKFTPPAMGKYYCKVTNKKNNTDAYSVTRIFYVV